jgi:aspartate/methionine/tyrosine aminotransferase
MPPDLAPTRLDEMVRSPFQRLASLLEGITPGAPVIDVSLGEPKALLPPFLGPTLQEHLSEFGRYPPIRGIPAVREAIAAWIGRRYPILEGRIDPERDVLPLNGSREGLFSAIFPALARKPSLTAPAVLIPNPFYQAYGAAAAASGAEPVFLPSTAATEFLPELDKIDAVILERAVALYLNSPSNPQGAVAGRDYLARAIALARRFDFLLFADECYSEIYWKEPPVGSLEIAGKDFANVAVFNSLSKRSSLPGLRIGFVAGDKRFIKPFLDLRAVSAPQVPVPAQEVAIAAYNDEAHVEENRALYRAKFDLADQIIGNRYGYKRPAGGFFLWLDVSQHGGSEGAALRLWKEAGLRVVPGNYAARPRADGFNPGEGYIRVAMVQDRATTAEALHRMVKVLG